VPTEVEVLAVPDRAPAVIVVAPWIEVSRDGVTVTVPTVMAVEVIVETLDQVSPFPKHMIVSVL